MTQIGKRNVMTEWIEIYRYCAVRLEEWKKGPQPRNARNTRDVALEARKGKKGLLS